ERLQINTQNGQIRGADAPGNKKGFLLGVLVHKHSAAAADATRPAARVADAPAAKGDELGKAGITATAAEKLKRENAVRKLLAAGKNPPRTTRWKPFNDEIRDECGGWNGDKK